LFLGQLRPEMFPGIGTLPEPATESHVVNRGTPVAPCRLKAQSHGCTVQNVILQDLQVGGFSSTGI